MKKTLFPIMSVGVIALAALSSCGGPKGYFKINQDDYKVTFNQLRTAYVYDCEANQKGDVRALVVPVEFTDYTADKLPAGRQGTLEDIQATLFGGDSTENPEMGWESLHSFYQKSSYGQCNITGTVGDWYQTGMTAADFERRGKNSVNRLVTDLYEYYSTGEGSEKINLDEYDANDDGYVDLLLMMYACPTGSQIGDKNSQMYWAYTTQYPNPEGVEVVGKRFSRYWWASWTFMYRDGYYDDVVDEDHPFGHHHAWTDEQIKNNHDDILDAHTFIHETGHGLGLADYYSYDYNDDCPMGGIDMMDNNIGDHNAYSKALYGWIDPYVVEDSCEITIRPFEEYGDSILVPIREIGWRENKYTLLDEYLMIQYDTPTGLAYMDGLDYYEGESRSPIYYNIPGIRILHTDSRMGAFTFDRSSGLDKEPEKVFSQYIKQPKLNNADYWSDFAHDNTLSRTHDGNRLLSVLEPNERAKFGGRLHVKYKVDNKALWQEGMALDNFKMNTVNDDTGKEYMLGFRIEIKNITPEGATIKFIAK